MRCNVGKQRKGGRMNCDVGKAREGLENELWRRWSDWNLGEWAELLHVRWGELILQPFCHFTYVTTHSPTLPSLYLRHGSFSNSSVASPTSRFILQPFFRFSYVTSSSLNSPGELSMPLDDGEFESCQLCGHKQGLLDELVQPAATVLCQSITVRRTLTFIGIVRAP